MKWRIIHSCHWIQRTNLLLINKKHSYAIFSILKQDSKWIKSNLTTRQWLLNNANLIIILSSHRHIRECAYLFFLSNICNFRQKHNFITIFITVLPRTMVTSNHQAYICFFSVMGWGILAFPLCPFCARFRFSFFILCVFIGSRRMGCCCCGVGYNGAGVGTAVP